MQTNRTGLKTGALLPEDARRERVPVSNPFVSNNTAGATPGSVSPAWLCVWTAIAAGYFLAGWFGLHLTSGYLLASPIWPPTGLALSAMLLLGRRIWPGIFAGAFLVNFARLLGTPAPWFLAGPISLAIGAGNTIEVLVGTWLISRFAEGVGAFRQPQLILRFTVATAAATLISASIGTAMAALGNLEGRHQPLHFWFTWWLGDLASAVVLTPLVLVWTTNRPSVPDLKRVLEAVALLGLLALIGWLVFSGSVAAQTGGANLTFMVVPPLLWAALRFGQRGTATLAFVIACFAIQATLNGHGPFAVANRLTSMLVLQNFTAVITIMSLMLAADVAQRQLMDAGLRASEQRYRELFEFNPQPMWVYDYETLRFLAVNDAAVHHYGYTRQEFLSLCTTEIRPPETIALHLEDVAQARAGARESIQRRHRKKDGSLIDVELTRHSLIFDGRPAAMVLCRDITESKRAARRATAFSELGRRLSAATSPRDAARIIAETADALFGWDSCILDLCSADQSSMEPVLCIDTAGGQRKDFNRPPNALHPFADKVLRTGPKLILRPDPPAFEPGLVPLGDACRPSASLMYVPLRDEHQAIGIFSIQSYRPNAYTEEDLRALQALAEHCSAALARIRAQSEIQRLNAELEQRVRRRTAQIEAINKELEAFCYSVSHDLRAPLRSIRGFSEVLLERYLDKLDASGREFLRRVCQSSAQMDVLIEDLLKLSRVSRNELQRRTVALSELAEEVVRELCRSEPHRQVECVITPHLQARGDAGLLRIVLENLLRNAWKFTGRQPKPRIEFGFAPTPQPAFFVRDNGAGFDMAHADRLFGVFQRLHSASEFPGTGVGLATVQRILNRHGGRAWAEGALEQGATFYFTLPGSALC